MSDFPVMHRNSARHHCSSSFTGDFNKRNQKPANGQQHRPSARLVSKVVSDRGEGSLRLTVDPSISYRPAWKPGVGVLINAATPLVFGDTHPSRNFLRAFVLQPRKQESPPSYQSTTRHPPSRTTTSPAQPPHHHHSATTKTTLLSIAPHTQPKWRTTAAPPVPPRKSPVCGGPGGLFTRWFRTGYAIHPYHGACSTRHGPQ